MSAIRSIFLVLIVACSLCVTPERAIGAPVHSFHCKECHLSGLTINELGGANVCLKCHNPTAGDVTLNDGAPPELDGHTEGRFITGDASNAFGHGTGLPSDDQTSHSWYTPSDTLAAAGAVAPLYSEHPEFYSRYGTSTGKLTCSRCHNPHEIVETNPKLLVKGAGSTDVMCRACHTLWNQSGNHGWLTHPIVDDYSASVASYPEKYRVTLSNKDNSDIQLVAGGISCTSCHGVHFVDSDATTADGVANISGLSQSDGKILLGNGPEQTDKSSLCQTCHTYVEHGDDTGEKPGCLICHSGHSYDPAFPNYFVLRKSATTTTYNTVTGLDYSSPSVLDDELKYTFWNDRTDGTANGYCEKCHGDAKDIGSGAGSYHVATAVCTDCHTHAASTFVSHGGGSGGNCEACHGHDAGYEYTSGLFSEGSGTAHSHSTHTENDVDDLRGPNIGCDGCHDINDFPSFKSGNDSDSNGVYSLNETDVCDACHSPDGTYDGVDDATLGAKPNWDNSIYNGLTLQAGKDKWCATCHDESPSVISSVNAPNVIGDEDGSYVYGTGWGYYKTGHGLTAGETSPSKGGVETLSGRPVECDSCHDYAATHIDGESRTYDDGDISTIDPSIYRQGYRLKLIGGQEPLKIPRSFGTANTIDSFRVCFQIGCHDSGPFTDSANMGTNLVTDGINRHEYHLRLANLRFSSDWSGAYNSSITCVNCHNVHGSTRLAMVRDGTLIGRDPGLQIWYKNDAISYVPFGTTPPSPEDLPLPASDGTAWIGASSSNLCSHCHGNGNVLTENRIPFQDIAQAPALEWVGTNSLTSDGVAPDSAAGNSTFTFRVSYSDKNNDSPSPIEIWVDLNDNNIYEAGEKYVMTEIEALDTNLFDGKTYSKSLFIAKAGDGVLNYRFYAHDGGLEATGAPTADSAVTILNNAPTLVWTGEDFYQDDGTNPDNGGNGDTFTFRIDYTDSDNDAPSAIQVWIDEDDNDSYEVGERYALNEVDSGDTTYSDGKLYARSLPLAHTGDGNLKYRFYASDANDDATGDPTQETLLTVQIGTNSPPSLEFVEAGCTVNGVKPQSGATGADFVFTVSYADTEGQCPPGASDVQLWVDVNDNLVYEVSEQYDLTEVDAGDTDCTDGKIYNTTRALTLAGDNVLAYRFYATDGIDAAVGEPVSDQSVTVVDALKVRPAGGSGWYTTIQSAIDAIDGAHTVLVDEGTYNEDLLFEFGSKDSNTTLRSACGPDTTIISGSGIGTTVTFSRYSSSQIDGFQVTGGTTGIAVNGTQVTINNCKVHDNNGLDGGGIAVIQSGDMPTLTLTNSEIYNNTSDRGAGVRIWRGTVATGHTISNSIIRNNTTVADGTFDGGGGINLSQVPNITISNSIIRDNVSDEPGGGLKVSQVPDTVGIGDGLVISDSMISGNTTDSWGGGVYSDLSTIKFVRSSITGNTSATMGGAIAHPSAGVTTSFENCIVADNQAYQAGMAKMNGGTLDIINSTIANNRATDHSGAIYNQLATITIRNSILWGNRAGTVGHFAHFNGGSITITDSIIQNDDDGNFTDEPFFTNGGTTTASGFNSEDDPWFMGSGDYHIQAPSPAIDNASATYAPVLDIDGESRPQGAADDIGADEY